ncbi:hypothetical protein D3C86_1808980 [compost metagenome]
MNLRQGFQHLFKVLGRQEIIFQNKDGFIEFDTLFPQQEVAGITAFFPGGQGPTPETDPVLVIRQRLQSFGETFKAIHGTEELEFDASGRQDRLDATTPLDSPIQANDVNFHELPLQTDSVPHAVQPSRWRP